MKYLSSEEAVEKICCSVEDTETNIYGFLSSEFM
jgi:hypothetical protein